MTSTMQPPGAGDRPAPEAPAYGATPPDGPSGATHTGATPPTPGRASAPLDRFFAALRSTGVRRRRSGRWVQGVCVGLADRLGIDPTVVRVLVVVLAPAGGLGVGLYLLGVCLLPDEDGRLVVERALRDGDLGPLALLAVTVIGLVGASAGGSLRLGGEDGVSTTVHPNLLLAGAAVLGWYGYRHGWFDRFRTPPRQPAPRSSATASGAPPGRTGWVDLAASTPRDPRTGPGTSAASATTTASATVPRGTGAHPVRPRRASLGARGALLAVGLAVTTSAAALLLHDPLGLPGPTHGVAAACALAAVSAMALVAGLRGRRGGLTSALVALLGVLSLGSLVPLWGADQWVARDAEATRWRPVQVSNDELFGQSTGGAVLDLTAIPPSQLRGQRVDARVSTGALRVVVPADVPVRVRSSVGLGAWQRIGTVLDETTDDALESEGTQDDAETGGRVAAAGTSLDASSLLGPAAAGAAASPVLTVDAHVGVGTLTIEKVSR